MFGNPAIPTRTPGVTMEIAQKQDAEALAAAAKIFYYETYVPHYGRDFIDHQIGKDLELLYGNKFIDSIKNKSADHPFVILKEKNNIIGFAELLMRKDHAVLDKIYISSAYQGKGLGRDLIKYCLKLAIDNDKSVMKLLVLKDLSSSIDFYKALGFKSDGERQIPLPKDGGKVIDLEMSCDNLQQAFDTKPQHRPK